MKHRPDSFEKRLEQLAPCALNSTWREKILETAKADEPCGFAWFLPKPLALGLAASWLLIGILSFLGRSGEPRTDFASPQSPASPIAHSYFETQDQLYAILAYPTPADSNE